MQKIILIIISIFIISCKTPQGMGEIRKMYVFDSFEERGYTTAGAYTHYDDMLVKKTNKIEVSQEDCKQFNLLLKSIRSKNHFQTKLGIKNVFTELNTEKSNIRAVICLPNLILDLSNNQEYWIRDKDKIIWLSEFINKNQYPKP